MLLSYHTGEGMSNQKDCKKSKLYNAAIMPC